MIRRLRGLVIGGPINLADPRIHRHLALVAFFAWVGLGSDGLSSSCYGPEEAFRQLGAHRHLALYLVGAMVGTVFLISASYSQIIEHFPSGGGGYLVATKLLGSTAGVVSGSALVVDYVLTVAISVAAGCDAIFSFLPAGAHDLKLLAEVGVVISLIVLNLRGIKESVYVLTPIFLVFIVTHIALISVGVLQHARDLGTLIPSTVHDTQSAVRDLGLAGVGIVVLRAFSLGGGTYTGIEAVSNGVGILREPRVENGKRTMLMMSCSLAFTAGGILLCYLLNNVQFAEGRTLNAVLWETLTRDWTAGDLLIGPAVVLVTLLSEGALLFVAAQTGFVDGPRTLSAMAADEWVPKWFKHLSERLVTQNGVLAMGLAAATVLYYTKGDVRLLVVMYSINVFLTFTLSQAGMARHWWTERHSARTWRWPLILNLAGMVVTGTILVVTATLKLHDGGWITLLATSLLVALCFAVRGHYTRVRRQLASLDEALTDLPLVTPRQAPGLSEQGPTAIVLVEAYNGLGIHTLLAIERIFPRLHRNVVFVSVGVVDSAQFKGADALHALEAKVCSELERYVELAEGLGLYAEYRYALGIDVVEELERLCANVAREFRRPIVFAGQLAFEREHLFTRTLHHGTAFSVQRRLQFLGIQTIILPIRVWQGGVPAT